MPHSTRTHVVLIPGFGGFDALGQVRYYTGITGLFGKWQKANPRADLVLHYFDNLPTSAVITRAERLRVYLAKRLARGEFVHGATYGESDKVILGGHSTGGLDARRLIYDLRDLQKTGRTILVDGQEIPVKPSDLLDLVRGLVFLSVPQYGTNIADWVLSHTLERKAFIGIAAVTASKAARDVPWQLMDSLKTHFTGWREIVIGFGGAILHSLSGLGPLASTLAAAGSAISTRFLPDALLRRLRIPMLGADLVLAIEDSIRESSQQFTGTSRINEAKAREAASQLQLYLDNANEDFGAILDLRNYWRLSAEMQSRTCCPKSPAHLCAGQREDERSVWRRNGISTLSFATVGSKPAPYHNAYHGEDGPVWDFYNLFDDFKLNQDGFDSTYLAAYYATAGGGFGSNIGTQQLKNLDGQDISEYIEQWDNDGIVNTASMLWPDGKDTRLARCDHGDIIGHYKRFPENGLADEDAGEHPGRRYYRYDIFVSEKRENNERLFYDREFDQVWNGVFGWCWEKSQCQYEEVRD